ncbi:MAG: hypothetical protein JNL36_10865 [Candidatus Kapabacteria bacterium]|nr:hypothetical protein [Candidatus Kapabacteria bacterium]
MSLPAFNTTNINTYLQSIETDATAYTAFAQDLQTNFLSAWQSRFTVSQPFVNVLNAFTFEQKQAVISGFNQSASFLSLNSSSHDKVIAEVEGFDGNPPPNIQLIPSVKVYFCLVWEPLIGKWSVYFDIKITLW